MTSQDKTLRERIEREAEAHEYFARNADLRMTTGDHALRAGKLRALAAALAPAAEAVALAPIERDEDFDREYIPLPGGWEVQTRGNGSTFRIYDPRDDGRLPIPDSPYMHETLTQMARDIHAAIYTTPQPAPVVDAERLLEIVARYAGKTSATYRYIAQDFAALAPKPASDAGEG